jgi:CTP:molybdopterin cytidylyltransferase MocA
MPKVPILLLAAGASSRMGSSKALLDWNKEPLIVSRIQNLLATGQKVYVVLGAYADTIIPVIKKLRSDHLYEYSLGRGDEHIHSFWSKKYPIE